MGVGTRRSWKKEVPVKRREWIFPKGLGGGRGHLLTLNIFDLMVNIISFWKINFVTISISFSTLFISVIVRVLSNLVDQRVLKESCRPFNLWIICIYSNNDQLVLIRFQFSTFHGVWFEISFLTVRGWLKGTGLLSSWLKCSASWKPFLKNH